MSSMCTTAVILVGGYGTRLRPLTLTRPKPLIPFCNEFMITHQIKALKQAGVTKIVLATNYRTDDIIREMNILSKELDIEIIFSIEKTPLGTGGPLKLALPYFQYDNEVFVLNSDIICCYPFRDLYEKHHTLKKKCTILTKDVDDPSRFGVIIRQNDEIRKFVEKPKKYLGNTINAGIYIMNTEVIENIPLEEVSLEKDIFTRLVKKNQLGCHSLQGYWKDIGQFSDFLDAQSIFLENKVIEVKEQVKKEKTDFNVNMIETGNNLLVQTPFHGMKSVLIHQSSKIGIDTKLAKNVVIGKNCTIGKGVYLENATLFDNCIINDYSVIKNSIVGYNCNLAKWTRIENLTILADQVTVNECKNISKSIILPNKIINENKNDTIVL